MSDLLRRAYRDISAGHTVGVVLSRPCYIRHLSHADQIDIDTKRQEFLDEAKREQWLTEDEKLAIIKKQGLWTEAQEQEVAQLRQSIVDLNEGKRKNANLYPSMVAGLVKQITEAEQKYEIKMLERRQLLGHTAEFYADRSINDHYIMANLFADPGLTRSFFIDGEFDYLSDDKVREIVGDYNRSLEGCTDHNLKKLAMQPFFQRYFGLVGDNLTQFFDCAVCNLTFYQVDLLRYGAHFRHIYSNHDVASFPKNVLEDPDLLTEYTSAAAKTKESLEKQGAFQEGAVVLGLKKEDAKAAGVQNQPNFMTEVMKSGGNVMDYLAKRRK